MNTATTFRRPAIAAALAAAAMTAVVGCAVDGTPTAAPGGAPITTTSTPDYSTPESYPTTTSTEAPTIDAPPPPDAQTITCRDYNTRDDSTQVAIVKANGVTKNPFLVATLVSILCRQRPDDTVNFVVNSMKDEIIHN
ncbi:hypothetical protein [Gordonia insulae]|uniref:Uncharacterized protein n=1 Tax=Gordonia insulae TaxID=2420509 RepID=A0A3G8JLE6_9ACTN|nr:hypothetical protein [Gordonia insulae]AZG45833.1 hypothetical protein D7316_02433 [Gordonia insulae]